MKTQLLTATKAGNASIHHPKISIQSAWLPDMGFIPEALVSVIPEPDGCVFTLCDENITKYSELSKLVKGKGGKLIQVNLVNKATRPYCSLAINFGERLCIEGLSVGTPLIAKYDYGIIRIRKLPNTKYLTVGSFINGNRKDRRITTINLNGQWLADAGFIPDVLATADASVTGCITIKLWDGQLERYSELVKYAREHSLKLLQVGMKQGQPLIGITGAFVNRAGFNPDDVFMVNYELGILKLQKPDPVD